MLPVRKYYSIQPTRLQIASNFALSFLLIVVMDIVAMVNFFGIRMVQRYFSLLSLYIIFLIIFQVYSIASFMKIIRPIWQFSDKWFCNFHSNIFQRVEKPCSLRKTTFALNHRLVITHVGTSNFVRKLFDRKICV